VVISIVGQAKKSPACLFARTVSEDMAMFLLRNTVRTTRTIKTQVYKGSQALIMATIPRTSIRTREMAIRVAVRRQPGLYHEKSYF
jgi:hypothetical protein